MKIQGEDVLVRDLQPGDFFAVGPAGDGDWENLVENGDFISIRMRTLGPLQMPEDMPVQRLHIERKRWTHGLRSTYIAGCRCTSCTAAQRVYMRSYARTRKEATAVS